MDVRRGLCIRGKWIRQIRRAILILSGQVCYSIFCSNLYLLGPKNFVLGTATLVEGPDDASMTYANSAAQFTIGAGCTFSESTLAICTIVAQSSTATQTEYISRLAIQGGATVSMNPSPTVSPTANPSNTGSSSLSTSPSIVGAPPNSTSSVGSKTSKPLSRSSLASILALVACIAVFLA